MSDTHDKCHEPIAFGAFGLLLVVTVAVAVWPDAPTFTYREMPRFGLAAGISFLAWWGVLWFVRTVTRPAPRLRADGRSDRRRFWLVALTVAVALRALPLLFMPDVATNSVDVYRYLWDGRMTDSGINPYFFAPEDPLLEPLRDRVFHPRITFDHLPTIHGPVAQMFFWVSYKLTPESIAGFKYVCLLVELLGIGALLLYLRAAGIDRRWSLVYLWCPSIVWESYYCAHLDVLALSFLFGALAAFHRDRGLAVGVLLALAGGVKLFAWVFLPLFLWRKPARHWVQVLTGCVVATVLVYAPFVKAGWGMLGALEPYLSQWDANTALYGVMDYLWPRALWIRWALVAGFGVWLLTVARSARTIERGWVWTWVGVMLFGFTLQPWYMMWAIPGLVGWRHGATLWMMAGTFAVYRYLAQFQPKMSWASHSWSAWIEYTVFAVLLLIGLWGHRKHRRQNPSQVVSAPA